ncbi:hypothetical protein LINPERHAP2_LOCUS20031 [Linum perenne]
MEDYERVCYNIHWLVRDHNIISDEYWWSYFEPDFVSISNLQVRVRLTYLLIESSDESIFTRIDDNIGKTVRIHETTLRGLRGNYAMICVEIDISKPLKSEYRLWRKVCRVEYEGLYIICFGCRHYGHSV